MIEAAMIAAGYSPGSSYIHNLGINVSDAVSSADAYGYTIKLANVAQADVAGGYYIGTMTTVATVSTYGMNTSGWQYPQPANFATPFTWDGVSNLCVEICYTHSSVGLVSTYGGCQWSTIGGNNHMGYNSGASVSCSSTNSWANNYLTNIRLKVSSAAACSGTPAVGNVSSATPCPTTSSTLTISGIAGGSGYTYQWLQSSSISGTYTNASGISTNATYATPGTLPYPTTYYKCDVTCSNSGQTTRTNAGTVTNADFLTCYCVGTYAAANSGNRGITNVTLGAPANPVINNTTTVYNQGAGTANRTVYTGASPQSNAGISLGMNCIMTVSVGSTTGNYSVGAWIDYNQNGIFESSEYLGGASRSGSGTVTINFTVPGTALPGTTAMRVRERYAGSAITSGNACTNFTGAAGAGGAGECEDYRVSISAGCSAPATSASSFGSSNLMPTTATISFNRGDGNGGVLVVARQGSAVNASPTSGTTYTGNAAFGSGSQIGTGNWVVYDGNAAGTVNVNLTALTANATYYFSVFEYNSAGTCYKLTSPLTGFLTTPICIPPTTQVSNVTAPSPGSASATLNWTAGNGNKTLIILRQGSAVSGDPAQTTGYTANLAYGSGTALGSGYVVFGSNGADNAATATVTGLLPSTTYYYAVYSYNSSTNCYNLTSPATGNFTTASCSPTVQPSNLSVFCAQHNDMTLNFDRGNGARAIVLAKAGSAVNADPVYNTAYTASANFGSGSQIGTGNYVVYDGNDAGTVSVPLTGLATGTTYYFRIYEYNTSPNCYNLTSAPTLSQATRSAGVYASSTVTQNTTTTSPGYIHQDIVGLQVVINGGTDPAAVMNSITFNTTGTTNVSDITFARVYFTGTSSTFSSATQFGSTIANPSGSHTVTGNVALAAGTNYFWVGYDVNSAANNGNVLDAQVTSFNLTDFGGTSNRTPSPTSPAGTRTIQSTQTYCAPDARCNFGGCNTSCCQGEQITSLNFGSGNFISGYACHDQDGDKGYDNLTASYSANLTAGSTYTLSEADIQWFSVGYEWCAWIDWDQDGVFEASERYPSGTTNVETYGSSSQSITVPGTATNGATVMRVWYQEMNYAPNANPCRTTRGPLSTNIGQVIDVTINVSGGVGGGGGGGGSACTTTAPTVTTPVTYTEGDAASQLSATGTSLLWYTAPSGGSGSGTAPTPLTNTVGTAFYYVSQTTGGCEGPRIQIAVRTNKLPCIVSCSGTPPQAAVVASPASFCGSGSAALSLTGLGSEPFSYQWEDANSAGGPWTNISGATAATYNTPVLNATKWYRCKVTCDVSMETTTSTSKDVKIFSLASVSVNPSSADACSGIPMNLTASGASAYAWLPAAGLNHTTGATVTATVAASVTYTVTGTDANGCTASATSTLTVNNASPVFTPSAAFIAIGSSANLSASFGGGASFAWSPAAGLNVNNAPNVVASPTATTTYTVTVTDANSCTYTSSIKVTVNPGTPGQVSCGYAYAQTTTPTWTPPSGGTALTMSDDAVYPNISLGFDFDFNGLLYNKVGISTNGFLWFGTTNPAANEYYPISTATALEGAVSVFGYNMTAGNGAALTYQTTGTAPNRVFTVYWNNVRGVGGDANSKMSFFVTLTEGTNKISVQYYTGDVQITDLYSAQVGLRGASNTDFNNLSVPCSSAGTFGWDAPTNGGGNTNTSAAVLNLQCPAANNTIGYITPRFYNNSLCALQGIYPSYGYFCTQGVFSWTPTMTTPTTTPSGTNNLCVNTAFPYSGGNSNPSPVYQWLKGGNNISGATNLNYTANEGVEGTYYYSLKVTSSGCSRYSYVTTGVVNPLPGIPQDLSNQERCDDGNVTFTVTNPGAGFEIQWSSDGVNNDLGTGVSLVHNITVAASPVPVWARIRNQSTGCTGNWLAASGTAHPLPVVNGTANPPAGMCKGDISTLDATGDAANYYWRPATWLFGIDGAPSVYASPPVTTTYTVTGVSAEGCSSTATTVLTIKPLPVITPSPISAVCTGQTTATLTASVNNGGSYVWSPNLFIISTNGVNDVPITVETSQLMFYTVTGTGLNGCTASKVVPVATVPVGGNATPPYSIVCSGGPGKLLEGINVAGNSYQWQTSPDGTSWTSISGETNTDYTALPSVKTYYRLLAQSNACWDVASTTAVVEVSNPTLTVTVAGKTDVSLTLDWSPIGGGNYNIAYSGTSSGSASNVTPPYTISSLTANGNYNITVTQTGLGLGGCPASGTLTGVTTLCAVPTGVTVSSPSNKQLKVDWFGDAGNYRVYYREIVIQGGYLYKDVTTTGNSGTTTITNLYGGGTYEVYVVRKDCPSPGVFGQKSALAHSIVKPLSACTPPPTINFVKSTCPGQIEVSMSGSPTGNYVVFIQRLTPTIAGAYKYNVSGGTFQVNVGQPGQTFSVGVASKCITGTSDMVMYPGGITIKPLCNPIGNLVLSSPTCNGFTASWNREVCSENQVSTYQLFMKRVGTLTWNSYPVNSPIAPISPYLRVSWLGKGYVMDCYVKANYICNGYVLGGPASTIRQITTLSAGCREEEENVLEPETPSTQIISSDNSEAISIYPNPNNGQFTLDISRLSNETVEVRTEVMNVLGQTVLTNISEANNGHGNEIITLPASVSAGTYFVRVTVGGNVYTAMVNVSR